MSANDYVLMAIFIFFSGVTCDRVATEIKKSTDDWLLAVWVSVVAIAVALFLGAGLYGMLIGG